MRSTGNARTHLTAVIPQSYHRDMKVAISIPDPIFRKAEGLAASLRKSRSQLYSEALAGYVNTHEAAGITERLNAVYAQQDAVLDPALDAAQRAALADEAW